MSVLPLSLDARPQSVKKFYFLDYFFVLLKSIQAFPDRDRIFERFLELKQLHQLGLSRYRTLVEDDTVSARTIQRYRYTFDQVVLESVEYELIRDHISKLELTSAGKQAIDLYENHGVMEFNEYLLEPMERRYQAFWYLLKVCYDANPKKHGLLIFPVYSANRLRFERAEIKTGEHLLTYCAKLQSQLERDILKHLGLTRSLFNENQELVDKLFEADLLPRQLSETFEPKRYNVILKRVRDFWLKYFLQDLYNYQFSLTSFDIWAYRAKQLGIAHITEFYPDPGFSGRIVYPLSIVTNSANSARFRELFVYQDGQRLFRHHPSWDCEETREEFVRFLHQSYVDIRRSVRSRFVNLANVRERVCYAMKIPEFVFDDYLSRAYHSKLKIRISMEVDKLPEETNAMYLKRTPVMIDGRYRNIIAIDLA